MRVSIAMRVPRTVSACLMPAFSSPVLMSPAMAEPGRYRESTRLR